MIDESTRSALCQEAAFAEKFRLIDQLADRHSISWLCKQLDGTRSGFYAWRQRQVAPGVRAADVIVAEIEVVFQEHRGMYGSTRIHQELRVAGRHGVQHRVARMMRHGQLRAKTRRILRPCNKACSTASGWWRTCCSRTFTPSDEPPLTNDITNIRTTASRRWLAVWIDLYSRHGEPDKLIIHTDQGSQYRASDYHKLLRRYEISYSMSAKGCSW